MNPFKCNSPVDCCLRRFDGAKQLFSPKVKMQIRSCRPYQKENAIRITGSYRAEGLHKVLYQCPRCLTQQNRITKLAFATEEIYRRSQHRAKALEAVASEKA